MQAPRSPPPPNIAHFLGARFAEGVSQLNKMNRVIYANAGKLDHPTLMGYIKQKDFMLTLCTG